MNEEITLRLDQPQELALEAEAPVMDDYNLLRNKPRINGVELSGNKLMNEFFPDGLIIDGGSAEGVI